MSRRYMIIGFLLLFLLLTNLSTCNSVLKFFDSFNSTPSKQETTATAIISDGRAYFHVVDEKGNPVKECRYFLGGKSKVTNSGTFWLKYKTEGIQITISSPGYYVKQFESDMSFLNKTTTIHLTPDPGYIER